MSTKFLHKILRFVNYNMSMSSQDNECKWRLQVFMKQMPTPKELRYLATKSKFKIQEKEFIAFKVLLDIQSRFLQTEESAPFKN